MYEPLELLAAVREFVVPLIGDDDDAASIERDKFLKEFQSKATGLGSLGADYQSTLAAARPPCSGRSRC